MLIKAITFDPKILKHNYAPYIKEILTIILDTLNKMLEHKSDTKNVSLISYANLLKTITFNVHPQKQSELKKELVSFD